MKFAISLVRISAVTLLAFAGLVGLLQAEDTHASKESGKGLTVELDADRTRVYGNDVHVGDEFRYTDSVAIQDFNTTLRYGIVYVPIVTKMQPDWSFGGAVTYRKGNWGVTVKGSQFATEGHAKGFVATPAPPEGDFYANGIRFFSHSNFPLIDTRKPGEASDVSYRAANALSVWTLDVAGLRNVVRKHRTRLDATGGLRVSRLENSRREVENLEAFIDAPLVWLYGLPSFNGNNFHNEVELDGASHVAYGLLKGPSFGLVGETKVGRFTFSAGGGHAVLFGSVRHSGNWIDTDKIWEWAGETRDTAVRQRYDFHGEFPLRERENAVIHVSDFSAKAIYRVVSHVGLSVGYKASVWQDVSLAQRWNMPGGWTSGAGTGWEPQRRSLTFSSLTSGLVFTF